MAGLCLYSSKARFFILVESVSGVGHDTDVSFTGSYNTAGAGQPGYVLCDIWQNCSRAVVARATQAGYAGSRNCSGDSAAGSTVWCEGTEYIRRIAGRIFGRGRWRAGMDRDIHARY